ncbi:efflux RND transporter periplasmic adaptor subunit [Pelomonas sp. V22]|uniref:efflux RND transporter periplasmic adaptor subunit n=1 Tax=Pelomonas sp. V22 TaxID=2822139 RepID=UPI0024A9311F|nr:efflux RND transporter periplasmic adaptor subunit [Pelomonas sp. V22]MDI4635241.1 efflux RND transporter periplasmic adaptor subunit [Pelomonas sp. V22]
MNSKTLTLALSLLALGVGMGWSVARWTPAPATQPQAAAATERKVLYWYDPMTPGQKFDKPGKSPYMDMQLQPRYADEADAAGAAISVAPRTVQSLGVRTAKVERRDLVLHVEALGTLQLNEREVSIVQARSGGFVEKVYARAPGDVIAAGAPLVDLLLPEWVAAQREYLAVRALGDAALSAASRQRLLLLGMPETVVAEVERSGQAQGRHTVVAPLGGLIAELMVRQGMTVSPGMSLARLNGLATMWFDVAVPEAQAGAVAPGQVAELRLAAFGAEVFKARVAAVLPEASGETRTLKVRLELPNRGLRLKAGMSGQASLQGPRQSELLVPSESVIRTGRRAVAYVVESPGRFRPVEVQLGREVDDVLVVTSGLEAGQEIVASAQFLIDSEASLRGVVPPSTQASSIPREHDGHAATYNAKGRITEIGRGELTLSHEAIPDLRWPAMTMGFKLANPGLLPELKVGQTVRFSFTKQGDDYLIVAVEPVAVGAASGARP